MVDGSGPLPSRVRGTASKPRPFDQRHLKRYACTKNCCTFDTESRSLGAGGSCSHVRADVAHIPASGEAVATLCVGPGRRNSSVSGNGRPARPVNLVPANSTSGGVAADDRAWAAKALCRGIDPDALFVRGAKQREAAVICRRCPVMTECGAEALDNKVEFGVWGGMTERQRRALLKQHPEVVSWTDFSPGMTRATRA